MGAGARQAEVVLALWCFTRATVLPLGHTQSQLGPGVWRLWELGSETVVAPAALGACSQLLVVVAAGRG